MGAHKHPYIHKAGDIMLKKIENAVIRKYGYEHKITIIIFRITYFSKKILDKIGKFWYNNNSESE